MCVEREHTADDTLNASGSCHQEGPRNQKTKGKKIVQRQFIKQNDAVIPDAGVEEN